MEKKIKIALLIVVILLIGISFITISTQKEPGGLCFTDFQCSCPTGFDPLCDDGICSCTGGSFELPFVSAEVAKSIAIEYWNSKYPMRTPETYFSVVDVISQNDNWLVEIDAYEEVPYEEPKYKGIAGKILVSKKSGKVTEQE